MSHVDEGTLHAYLDGELAPVERERVDTHLKGCPACQARLAEERAIIERASRLLGMATPPERAMPPLAQLRPQRLPWWRVRQPLAWAATLILAVGLGWYARGRAVQERADVSLLSDVARLQGSSAAAAHPRVAWSDSERVATVPQGHLAMRRPSGSTNSLSKDREALHRQLEPAGLANGQVASNSAPTRDTTAMAALGEQKVDAVGQPPAAPPSSVAVRGDRAAARAEPQPRPAAPAAEFGQAQSGVVTFDGAQARRRASVIMSTTWPIIARLPARDVLGSDPVVIPGFAIRGYRRNPAAREIVVEQVTDAGTTISLIERRMDSYGYADSRADSGAANAPSAMAKTVNERLARFVGPLRIEIDGPLTPDSLSSLLELAR